MPDFLNRLLESNGFMPHGHCYLWNPHLVRLHVFTDLAIGLSYVAISLTLAYLVYRAKQDVPFSWIFVCFGVFIIACAGTHFMEVWTLWTPVYWLAGAVKFVTATASVLTAIALPPLVPRTLALIRAAKLSEQGKAELESVNLALQREILERNRHEEEFRKLNVELEQRVAARTVQLEKAGQDLARMAAIVEYSDDAILSLNLDGSITSWNPAAERLYGHRPQEILGRPITVLAPPDLSKEMPALLERIQRGEHIRSFETTGVRGSGRKFSVHVTLSSVRNQAGVIQGTSLIARDVSDRKRAEEEIQRLNQDLEHRVTQRTKELTAANAELEAFSYTVSHDLRAPLRQIAGFANILDQEHASELSPEFRRYLQQIQDGAQQMGILIDDLLNLARIGRHPISRALTLLNGLVSAALAQLDADNLHRDIEWHVDDLGSVECDPALIRLVFVNLLSNAIKYTRPRDHAMIHVGRTTLGAETVFFVCDNGAGFDMQYAGKLFGVFQRLHKAKDFEGTGVGLATVHRIIHKHGGRVWAEAELDKGATFSFTIPPGEDSPAPYESAERGVE